MTYLLAGTGSRSFDPINNGNDQSILRKLYNDINALSLLHKDLVIVSGGAEGWDHQLAMLAKIAELPLKLMLPNEGYAKYYWQEHSITGRDRMNEFNQMLGYAITTAGVIYVCDRIYVGGTHSNFIRNQEMTDLADEFVVYNPKSRGTRDCLTRIKKKNIPYTVYGE